MVYEKISKNLPNLSNSVVEHAYWALMRPPPISLMRACELSMEESSK